MLNTRAVEAPLSDFRVWRASDTPKTKTQKSKPKPKNECGALPAFTIGGGRGWLAGLEKTIFLESSRRRQYPAIRQAKLVASGHSINSTRGCGRDGSKHKDMERQERGEREARGRQVQFWEDSSKEKTRSSYRKRIPNPPRDPWLGSFFCHEHSFVVMASLGVSIKEAFAHTFNEPPLLKNTRIM